MDILEKHWGDFNEKAFFFSTVLSSLFILQGLKSGSLSGGWMLSLWLQGVTEERKDLGGSSGRAAEAHVLLGTVD